MPLTKRFNDLFQERREKKEEAGDLPASTVFSNSLSFKIFNTPVSYFEADVLNYITVKYSELGGKENSREI